MKKLIISFAICMSSIPLMAQEVGLAFSYFLPRNGYFSTPISPFSLRGIGVNLNRFLALQTGATLYRMAGLNLIDLPFESNDALIGPNFTLFVPAEIVFQLHSKSVEFDLKAGGFFFYGLGNKINYGNLDRAIRAHENWAVSNSDVQFKNHPGFGYHFGAELTFPITRQVKLSFEANYLIGQAKFPLTGSYTGGMSTLQTKTLDYPDAKVDFTGLEFSVGISFSTR
jgi:hypothetical protein